MEILRTPEERFSSLPDFPYTPRYAEIRCHDSRARLRMHYVDEGPADAPIVLMLHGEPSWSFLYRKVIRKVVSSGLRAIAPDLIGFGRSDKPAAQSDYSYQRHVDWMGAFLDILSLHDITLLCQDWGGLIGLRLVGEQMERFVAVVAANTFLPTGDLRLPEAFFRWRDYSQAAPVLRVGRIVGQSVARGLAPEVLAAYDAPFPEDRYQAGARALPMLVPTTPDDPASEPNRRAWEALRHFERPFVTAFSDEDPITRGGDLMLQAQIPGARGRRHPTFARAGHFLQEDVGDELGAVVVDLVRGGSG